jgi:hypothetical protein
MKVIAEIKILRNDNIAQVTMEYQPAILTGPCTMEFRVNKHLSVDRSYIGSKRKVIRPGRHVYEYFLAPDTNANNDLRWEIIKAEMNNPADIIEEITLFIAKDI